MTTSLSTKASRLYLTDPSLLLPKTTVNNGNDRCDFSIIPGTNQQSIENILNITNSNGMKKSTTNLNTMKTYSVSDSEINYKFLEEIEEAQGSSAYINRSGTINFGVVLAGIHAVICKEHHLKVCELVMNILDVLFGLNVISSTDDDTYKKQFHIMMFLFVAQMSVFFLYHVSAKQIVDHKLDTLLRNFIDTLFLIRHKL